MTVIDKLVTVAFKIRQSTADATSKLFHDGEYTTKGEMYTEILQYYIDQKKETEKGPSTPADQAGIEKLKAKIQEMEADLATAHATDKAINLEALEEKIKTLNTANEDLKAQLSNKLELQPGQYILDFDPAEHEIILAYCESETTRRKAESPITPPSMLKRVWNHVIVYGPFDTIRQIFSAGNIRQIYKNHSPESQEINQ